MPKELPRLPSPTLLCVIRPDLDKTITEAGYQMVSLNLPLARSLAGLTAHDIRAVLTEEIRRLIPQGKPVYLTGYEMLFDPRYELDVIRLFIELSRQNTIIIRWCGAVGDDVLTYAEKGYADYKQYKMNAYDVTIVK
jgi:hypothetical protein